MYLSLISVLRIITELPNDLFCGKQSGCNEVGPYDTHINRHSKGSKTAQTKSLDRGNTGITKESRSGGGRQEGDLKKLLPRALARHH